MSSSHRLVLGTAVILCAVVLALPFKKHLLDQQGRHSERKSRVRWHQAQASVPTPLEVHDGESSAEDLRAAVSQPHRTEHGNLANRVSHAVAIRESAQPPRIPSAYQPLLKARPAKPPRAEATNEASDLPNPVTPDSSGNAIESDAESDTRVIRHRIRDGDTLQALAARYLGDPSKYREIYERNKDRLPSAEVLPLNLTIEIYVPR